MKYCPHCGKTLPEPSDAFKFCPECGNELPSPENSTPSGTIEFQSGFDAPKQQPVAYQQVMDQISAQVEKASRPAFHWWYLLPILIGLPFFLIGLSDLLGTAGDIKNDVTIKGVVVDNTITLFSDGESAYVPVIEFYTNGGEKIRFTDSSVGSIPPAYQPGDRVEVIYDPANPRQARIRSFVNLYLFGVIFMAVGLLPMLIVLIIMIYNRRASKKRPVMNWGNVDRH